MSSPDSIQTIILQKLKELFPNVTTDLKLVPIGGGSINETYQLTFGNQQLFCKVNSASKFPHLFQKEKNGLDLIAQQNIIKTPNIIDCFESGEQQFLLLEWIKPGERTEIFWNKFGEQLAALHQVNHQTFGLGDDNYMGSVPQSNKPSANWTHFFIEYRLQPLIKKCIDKNLLSLKDLPQFENLYLQLPTIFDKTEKPSLLHGDLWSGNFMCDQNSVPVLIDPAVYFGHPSVDLAMTTLFGGFQSQFYDAYNYHSPFPANYKEQWDICNLYPLLIHLLLFGRSYLQQIEQTLKRFAE